MLEEWVIRRMFHLDLGTAGDYLSRLESNETERSATVHHVLNGATGFFRDAWMWQRLTNTLERVLAQWSGDRPFRVWNPACSTGEEAFSIAMIVEAAMRRRGLTPRYVVIASAINSDAIVLARTASYSSYAIADVPTDLRDRFFACQADRYAARDSMRRAVVFAFRNVFTDFPISHTDLLVCRNLMIYLRPNYRDWLVSLFHYALRPDGILFLGPADSIGHNAGFSPVEHLERMYSRAPGTCDLTALIAGPTNVARRR
jgi:two-component system CheB/CheR fusion protein